MTNWEGWEEAGAQVLRSDLDDRVWVASIHSGEVFEYSGAGQDLIAGGFRAVRRWCEHGVPSDYEFRWRENVLMVRPRSPR